MTPRALVRTVVPASLAALALAAALPAAAHDKHFKANLDSFEEVPAVWSPGGGKFSAKLNKAGTELTYELEYDVLGSTVTQAHIHFAQKGVNGGIMVFLCTNLGNGPAGTQPCPAAPATVTGTLTAADVTNNAVGQNIAAGQFDRLVEALREGVAYTNVHTTGFPGGEIRGQLK